MPRTLHTYTVVPSLPTRLAPLHEMAYNLRWAWDHATRALFQAVDADQWEQSEHNPAKMLDLVAQARLQALAADEAFLAHLDTVYTDFTRYMQDEAWWQRTAKGDATLSRPDFKIAYFSAEFGLTECLPIYSGGLGVLAGDHLKSASDLGLPLVGMGFLYQKGYFRQSLNADGWQVENKPTNDFYSLPIEPVKKTKEDGSEEILTIAVNFPGRQVWAQVWKAQVGRVPLYLLDTNLARNNDADRQIAGNLYGGDEETRIQQEIVLGIGGIHALAALGIHPSVCHMNEGHSAFLALERIRRLVQEDGLSFADATEASAAGNIFTTHTPVPAGFDVFPPDLMRRYFADYARDVHLPLEELINRGRAEDNNQSLGFNMAILAFRHARSINGVSKLHGQVSRQMAQMAFPDIPQDEVPVGSVTNGIHTRSFLSHEMVDLLRKYVGEPTGEALSSLEYWAGVDRIPNQELWRMHEERRDALVNWARRYQERRLDARGASEREIGDARRILDPQILTVGFARRFATYKRGDLLLRDRDRILRLLGGERPVQFVFAGKAHPKDDEGKKLIQHIVHFAREAGVGHRLVFLEDYDMAMARQMVQGVDVWLNNPRRPQEASGTSGMKVVPNGGLNFSVLDGWWAEGYDPSVGWEIGRGQVYDDTSYQDHVESQDIYETLERDIVPLFYDRDVNGLPQGWIARMKASMKKLAPVFNTSRMVREYAENYYIPAARHAEMLCEASYGVAKSLVQWKRRVRMAWGEVHIENVQVEADKMQAGEQIGVRVRVHLGASLSPDDVRVQLYTGPIDADRQMMAHQTVNLESQGVTSGGVYEYAGHLPSDTSGMHAFSVRVLPFHPNAVLPQELPLIAWE